MGADSCRSAAITSRRKRIARNGVRRRKLIAILLPYRYRHDSFIKLALSGKPQKV